ncbi:MFS transporter [Ensifer sp. Root31]|uniref:MFS transporter n=1 Tax=Ensifer sp. Root31 TaxID=1736512 RepID=UPI00070A6766|nr:MFS transporter [Ensifer sp. Root31]KQU72212.1 MFS transporter [Ensifer sp. Root31]MDP9628055.1 MFS family permease [Ensifer adhaerens]
MSTVVAFVPERTSWTAVTAVVAAGMVAAMQVGKGLIAGPLLQADLGLDLTALGWLTSVFAIVGVVGGMPAGAMVAAIGDRRMLGVGMGILLLGIITGAASQNFTLLILSRIFEGFGFLLVVVAGPAILMRIVGSGRRDLVFAVWSCFMPAGMAIAMLTGPLFASWQAIWWINGLVALLSLLTIIAAISPSQSRPRPSAGGFHADVIATVKSRGPVLLFALFALYSLMTFTLSSFLPILLVALGTAGVLSALITLSNVIGNLAAGHMLSRGVGRGRLVITAATLMGAAGLWIFLSQSGDLLTFTSCVLFSAIGGLIPATLISTVPMLSPSPAPAPMAMGLLMQGSNLGQLVGPVAVGTAIEVYGWTSGAAFIGIGALACILLATTLDRALPVKEQKKA